jgi:peptidoglycan hydrolase FlgJ
MVADARITTATDLQGLSQLRSQAAERDPRALDEAARQFEALFLQMMLKSMRDAGAAFAEDRDRSYDDMLDQQLALEMSRQGSIGIADLITRQIELRDSTPAEESPLPASMPRAPSGLSTRRREDFRPADPREFVHEVWPHARQVADELGVDARTIMAQAALETGWGQRMIRDGRGVSANNLFGIKGDGSWRGEQVRATTLEHDPAAGFTPKVDVFRAYGTVAEGLAGYAEFLRTNPRYEGALASGSNGAAFVAELQAAGYATDPRYAEKIHAIATSSRLEAYLSGVGGGE